MLAKELLLEEFRGVSKGGALGRVESLRDC